MIKVTFPDGSSTEQQSGVTGLALAQGISEGLARNALAIRVNQEVVDLSTPITHDATIQVLTFEDPDGLEVFRHSSTHLMAQAVVALFPEAKLTIGPVVDEGYYYDIDHAPFSPADVIRIEAKMKEIVKQKLPCVRHVLSKKEALTKFKDNAYKIEMINEMEGEITAYSQGDFFDLCRGPHVQHTGQIKAFSITKIAGAYWRADANNKQLQRLYGISFPDKKLLSEYTTMMEEAKSRDHRKIAKELDLCSFHDESPGSIFYHPKGAIIFHTLQEMMRKQYEKRGFKEVITPLMYDKSLWETSGHWQHFQENMFILNVDGREASLKPMNCPSHCLIYKTSSKSYRDLPLRMADFAPLHRNELRGTLGGMMRVRKMQQDDAHIFCTLEQLHEELDSAIEFAKYVYEDVFKFEYRLELSTKPDKAMGTPEQWTVAETALRTVLDKHRLPYTINPGDGAFYGPKIDMHIKDAIGRSHQLSTIQLDFQMPQRFGLQYEGSDGHKHTPIMIHRAILGSLDRFMGVFIEHCAGKFPLWLAPIQARILPIADRHLSYCQSVAQQMRERGIRVEVDSTAETTQKKVRNAQLQKINYMLICGDREIQDNTVNVRKRDGSVLGPKITSDWITYMLQEINSRS